MELGVTMTRIEEIAYKQGWTLQTLLSLILDWMSSDEEDRLVEQFEALAAEENSYSDMAKDTRDGLDE
jgi:hypothetical protein